MANRGEIERLKASRSGFKAAVTRISNSITRVINDADPTDKPSLIQAEIGMKQWKEALDRYVAAEDAVMGPNGWTPMTVMEK